MVDAGSVPEPAPIKSLSERVAYAKPRGSKFEAPLTKNSANPKAQPKSATTVKAAGRAAGVVARGRGGKRVGTREKTTKRAKPKTAEELDAEMTDYFNNNGGTAASTEVSAAAVNGGAQPAANTEDLGMTDEISVDYIDIIT